MTDDDILDAWAPGGAMSQPGGSTRHRSTVVPHHDRPESSTASRRRRSVVLVGLVLVVGATVVSVVATSSDGDAPAPEVDPSTSVRRPTTTGPRSAPPPTAGTNPGAGRRSVSAEVSPDLPVVDLRAVVFASDGMMHEVDLAARTLRSTEAAVVQSGAPVYAFVDAGDEIVVVAYDNVPGFRLDADRSMAVVAPDDQTAGLLWPGPFGNTAWQLGAADRAGAVSATLVDLNGTALGVVVDVDGSFVGSDARGGLLVEAAGGFYEVGSGPPNLVTGGDLLAIGAAHALGYECDADLACEHVRIDRTTGDRTVVDTGAAGLPVGFEAPSQSLLAGGMSPNGEVAVVRVDDSLHGFVDLVTGATTDVRLERLPMPIVWSADGRVALFASSSGVQLYVREGGRLINFDAIGRPKAIVTPAPVGELPVEGSLFETGTAFENGTTIEADLLVSGAGT